MRSILIISAMAIFGGSFVILHIVGTSDHSSGHPAAPPEVQASGAPDGLRESRLDQSKSQGSLPAASSSPIASTLLLSDYDSNIKNEALEWANSTFLANPSGVEYDRVRLVNIDWFSLLQPIKSSELYLHATSDGTAEGFSAGELYLKPFGDRRYRLLIERADVYNVNGLEVIALLGTSLDVNGQRGSWQMSIDEYDRAISGHIDAPDGYTTYGPGPDKAFHVFRDVSQDSRREQMAGKTY